MAVCWWLSHSIWNGARRMSAHLVAFVSVVPAVFTPIFTLRVIRGAYRYLYSWAFSKVLGGEPSAHSLGYLENTPLPSPHAHSPFTCHGGDLPTDSPAVQGTPIAYASASHTPAIASGNTGSAGGTVRRRHGRSRPRSGSTASNASNTSGSSTGTGAATPPEDLAMHPDRRAFGSAVSGSAGGGGGAARGANEAQQEQSW